MNNAEQSNGNRNEISLFIAPKSGLHDSTYSYVDNSSKPRRTNQSLSKKALFFTSVPFYWLVFFTKVLNFFDLRFFIFVVIASIIMSFLGKNWGVLNILLK